MSEHKNTSTPSRKLPSVITLSEKAALRLTELYATAQKGKLLRIQVSTKGCSGMGYDMTFVDEPTPQDDIVHDKGVTLLVDRKATLFIIGTVMDYEEHDLSSGFVFSNPNEKGRCGCGESFHI